MSAAIERGLGKSAVLPVADGSVFLQEARLPWPVQRLGGQAAADGADGRPHVRGLREDHSRHIQAHGHEQNVEALRASA